MNKIIDSLCGQKESFQSVLQNIIVSQVSLQKEKDLAIFLTEAYENHGEYPTREYTQMVFELELEQGPALGAVDLLVHLATKDKERAKVKAASILQEASNAILEGKTMESVKDVVNAALVDHSRVHIDIIEMDELSLSDFQNETRKSADYRFGIEDLDSLTMGIESGTAVVVGGYVGSFKTTYAISMAVTNAIVGNSSAILTLEMPPRALKAQAISNFSFTPSWPGNPIPYQPILKQRLDEDEKEDLRHCEEAYAALDGRVSIFSASSVSPDLMHGLPRGCKALADQGINALYIDHVQLLKYYVDKTDGVHGVDRFVKIMTDTAVELAEDGYDFRVIFLSQINRDSYKKALRRGGQYDLTAMAEYNELERSASYMVTLFSTDELKAVNEVRIQLLKHRLGQCLEEPVSVFVDPGYSVVGGVSAMADFEASEEEVTDLLGGEFGF